MSAIIEGRICSGCGGSVQMKAVSNSAGGLEWTTQEPVCDRCRQVTVTTLPEIYRLAEEYRSTLGFNYCDIQYNPDEERRKWADLRKLCDIIAWIKNADAFLRKLEGDERLRAAIGRLKQENAKLIAENKAVWRVDSTI